MKIEDGILISVGANDIDSEGKCVVPYGVTVIGEKAFVGNNVKSIIIPNSVVSIGNKAFYFCESLEKITIPDSITKIGGHAFSGCGLLNKVYISNLTSWCNIDFENSRSNPLFYKGNLYFNGELITKLVIPSTVTDIKKCAFIKFSNQQSPVNEIVIPDSVISIGENAFQNYGLLESIRIPYSVKNIDHKAFSGCNSLSKAIIEGEPEYVDYDIFCGCENLDKIIVCSENMKQRFTEDIIIPNQSGCSIIVDTFLNKSNDIRLGSEYLSYAAKDTFDYNEEPDNIEINEGDVL